MRYCMMVLALILLPFGAVAQESAFRDRLMTLMSMDCGIGEAAGRFRLTAIQSPAEARAVFLDVLQSGPSADRAAKATVDAGVRYDRYLAWAKRNAAKPHARRFLDGPGRDAFIAAANNDLQLLYRTNALRGLALSGTRSDRSAIELAIREQPLLAQMGQIAVTAISKR